MSVYLDNFFPQLSSFHSLNSSQQQDFQSERGCVCSELPLEDNTEDAILLCDKAKVLNVQIVANSTLACDKATSSEKNDANSILDNPEIFDKIFQSFNHHRIFGIVPIINSLTEEPEYVNRTQYSRIIKRKFKRKEGKYVPNEEQQENCQSEEKKNYRYESRHVHAVTRERDSNGRFTSRKSFPNAPKNMKAIEKPNSHKGRNVKKKGPTTKWSPHTLTTLTNNLSTPKASIYKIPNTECSSNIFYVSDETPNIENNMLTENFSDCNVDYQNYEFDIFGNSENIFSSEIALHDYLNVKPSSDSQRRFYCQRLDAEY